MLYAASLWLSNSAYLYLSVSFIQMTKSLMPGLVYACGVALGTEKYEVSDCLGLNRHAGSCVGGLGVGVLSQTCAVWEWQGGTSC